MEFFHQGHGERTKADFHAALGALALTAFTYNAISFCLRPSRHLVANAVLYFGLVLVELHHVQDHRGAT